MKNGFVRIFFFAITFQCTGQFSPTNAYIAANEGKWTIEVPEVQELVHIIIAISPIGQSDKNMVQHFTQYHKKVIDHFGRFEGHEVVTQINNLLANGLYARLKMDACGFYFNDPGKLVKDNTYGQLNWGKQNYVEPLIASLEDFSTRSGFREFYSINLPYYHQLIELSKVQMPIDKQWKWLEERFPNRYDNYRITFSPLVNGSHSTNRFETDNFKQTVMFICGPIGNKEWSVEIKEGLMSRVVFTEIDHNYVNPVSDKFERRIKEIFKDRSKWTSGKDSKNYGSSYAIFNEYMTWSVFNLYVLDTFKESDFKAINERVEFQMMESRGFPKFKEFNRKLIALYQERKIGQDITDLYPLILEWCQHQ